MHNVDDDDDDIYLWEKEYHVRHSPHNPLRARNEGLELKQSKVSQVEQKIKSIEIARKKIPCTIIMPHK